MANRKITEPTEHLIWTDWRGNEYTVGDTVLYARMSGRSCEMAEGVVADLWETYHGDVEHGYKWVKLKPGELAPFEEVWRYRNLETGELEQCGWGGWREREGFEQVRVTVRKETERRAAIWPGRTSRFKSYSDRERKFDYDFATGTGEFRDLTPEEKAKIKPIRLSVTESITLPWP